MDWKIFVDDVLILIIMILVFFFGGRLIRGVGEDYDVGMFMVDVRLILIVWYVVYWIGVVVIYLLLLEGNVRFRYCFDFIIWW